MENYVHFSYLKHNKVVVIKNSIYMIQALFYMTKLLKLSDNKIGFEMVLDQFGSSPAIAYNDST